MLKFSSKLWAEKSNGERNSHGVAKLIILTFTALSSWVALALRWFLTLTVATGCLYQVVASPPLHLMGFSIEPAAAGEQSSIYVPGAAVCRLCMVPSSFVS